MSFPEWRYLWFLTRPVFIAFVFCMTRHPAVFVTHSWQMKTRHQTLRLIVFFMELKSDINEWRQRFCQYFAILRSSKLGTQRCVSAPTCVWTTNALIAKLVRTETRFIKNSSPFHPALNRGYARLSSRNSCAFIATQRLVIHIALTVTRTQKLQVALSHLKTQEAVLFMTSKFDCSTSSKVWQLYYKGAAFARQGKCFLGKWCLQNICSKYSHSEDNCTF